MEKTSLNKSVYNNNSISLLYESKFIRNKLIRSFKILLRRIKLYLFKTNNKK